MPLPIRKSRRIRGRGLAALLAWAVLTAPAAAQPAERLPFFVGEALTFRVQAGRVGTVGTGTMRVQGPEAVRGVDAYRLAFHFDTRVGPVRAVDRTESWLDPQRMATLRFYKHERHPLSSHDELVELFPAERRWTSADGQGGASPTDAPLDELSFLYFVRTLPLADGADLSFNRHFEPGRNPVRVRVLGRETLSVPAGTFRTIAVELRVKDPRRYRGEGVIRMHLTDDACRLPVRIESSMPVLGRLVLSLQSHTHPQAHAVAAR